MKIVKILLVALATIMAGGAQAQDYGVKFWRTNGEAVCVAFSKNPNVYLRGGYIEMAADEADFKVAIDEVSKWTFFTVDPSAVKRPGANDGICISLTGDMVRVSGLVVGAPVTLRTTDGRCVARGKADASGAVRLSTGALGRAVYILQTSGQIVKFIKN